MLEDKQATRAEFINLMLHRPVHIALDYSKLLCVVLWGRYCSLD